MILLKLLKAIFKKEKLEKKHIGKTYEEISIGDVIFAKRIDTKKILEGHEQGPYVIVDRDKDYLYGLYWTSKVKDTSNYKWCNINFIEDKDTYIFLDSMDKITKDRFLHYMASLSIDKLNLLKKNLMLNKNNKEIKRGSVVKLNKKLYYIYGEYKDKWMVYRLNIGNIKLTINNREYTSNLESGYILKSKNLTYICESNLLEDENIMKIKKINKNEMKNTNKTINIIKSYITPGKAFYLNNAIYYVVERKENTLIKPRIC